MSMRKIAEFLSVNGAVNGNQADSRRLSIPDKNQSVRYQLWQGDTGGVELFTLRSSNRTRNGLMSRFMM